MVNGTREMAQWLENLLLVQRTGARFPAPLLVGSHPPVTPATGDPASFLWPPQAPTHITNTHTDMHANTKLKKKAWKYCSVLCLHSTQKEPWIQPLAPENK